MQNYKRLQEKLFELSLDQAYIVEANAGTGKTHNLVKLYIRILCDRMAKPAEVLAVTFTDDATGELRERVSSYLYSAVYAYENQDYSQIKDDDLVQFLQEFFKRPKAFEHLQMCINELDEAAIYTIHGFCRSVLQDYSFYCKIDPNNEINSNTEDYIKEAIERAIFDVTSWSDDIKQGKKIATLLEPYLTKNAYDNNWPVLFGRLSMYIETADGIEDLDKELIEAIELLGDKDIDDEITKNCFLKVIITRAKYYYESIKKEHKEWDYDDLLVQLKSVVQKEVLENEYIVIDFLRKKFKGVLIDEFQDTDDTQFYIFKHCFIESNEHPVFLLGDPKQAIYSFRGANMNTYLFARDHVVKAENRLVLNDNWRTEKDLLHIVNQFFTTNESFASEDISFIESNYPSQKQQQKQAFLPFDDKPLVIHNLEDDPSLNLKNVSLKLLGDSIVELLKPQSSSGYHIENEQIKGSDIAIICRSNHEIVTIKDYLNKRGIASVIKESRSVYQSDEARDLYALLFAINNLENLKYVKAAYLSPLLSANNNFTDQLDLEKKVQAILPFLIQAKNLWYQRGIRTAFNYLDDELGLLKNLTRSVYPDRALTNIKHLIELIVDLERNEKASPQFIVHHLSILTDKFQDAKSKDDSEIRLETEEQVVQIVTVHKSKGLEYKVVFMPFPMVVKKDSKNKLVGPEKTNIYGANNEIVPTILWNTGEQSTERFVPSESEIAENIRMFYVAVTRAKYQLHIICPPFKPNKDNEGDKSVWFYLLTRWAEKVKIPKENWERTYLSRSFAKKYDQYISEGSDNISYETNLVQSKPSPLKPPEAVQTSFDMAWLRSSFSSISHAEKIATDQSLTKLERYLDKDPNQLSFKDDDGIKDAFGKLPSGASFGSCVHEVLEELVFSRMKEKSYVKEFMEPLLAEKMIYYKIPDFHLNALSKLIQTVLLSPFIENESCLADLEESDYKAEIEFLFKVNDTHQLNPIFEAMHEEGLVVSEDLIRAKAKIPNGFLTGFIDLSFRYKGKLYLLDYKTNYLGSNKANYSQENMKQSMIEHSYYLQLLLYSLSYYKRFLLGQKSTKEFDDSFGGVYYLFVRGLDEKQGQNGVIYARPSAKLLENLHQNLSNNKSVSN